MKKKIAAVIPACNEEKTIAQVIRAVKQSKHVNEIIVIDDGSTDETLKIIKKIKGIKSIHFKKNKGKANALAHAITKANAEIIFLCDADLKNFTGVMADTIITPVLKNKTPLSIGIRNNSWYRLIMKLNLTHPIFFLSGQRAFIRSVWNTIPRHYKHGYRIELGMNFIAQKKFKRLHTVMLPYSQYIKEQKLGFLNGSIRRIKMIVHILQACARFQFYDRFRLERKTGQLPTLNFCE